MALSRKILFFGDLNQHTLTVMPKIIPDKQGNWHNFLSIVFGFHGRWKGLSQAPLIIYYFKSECKLFGIS